MKAIDNGNTPAMPVEVSVNEILLQQQRATNPYATGVIEYQGLTKREQFAIAAMQGMLSESPYCDDAALATVAVERADALLKALEVKS